MLPINGIIKPLIYFALSTVMKNYKVFFWVLYLCSLGAAAKAPMNTAVPSDVDNIASIQNYPWINCVNFADLYYKEKHVEHDVHQTKSSCVSFKNHAKAPHNKYTHPLYPSLDILFRSGGISETKEKMKLVKSLSSPFFYLPVLLKVGQFNLPVNGLEMRAGWPVHDNPYEKVATMSTYCPVTVRDESTVGSLCMKFNFDTENQYPFMVIDTSRSTSILIQSLNNAENLGGFYKVWFTDSEYKVNSPKAKEVNQYNGFAINYREKVQYQGMIEALYLYNKSNGKIIAKLHNNSFIPNKKEEVLIKKNFASFKDNKVTPLILDLRNKK